jgi:hypothetical protein
MRRSFAALLVLVAGLSGCDRLKPLSTTAQRQNPLHPVGGGNAGGGEPSPPPRAPAQPPGNFEAPLPGGSADEQALKAQADRLQGVWIGGYLAIGTEPQQLQPSFAVNRDTIQRRWDIGRRGNKFQIVREVEQVLNWKYTLSLPNLIDLECVDGVNKGTTYPGILKIEQKPDGTQLMMAFDLLGRQRPSAYEGVGATILVMMASKR